LQIYIVLDFTVKRMDSSTKIKIAHYNLCAEAFIQPPSVRPLAKCSKCSKYNKI